MPRDLAKAGRALGDPTAGGERAASRIVDRDRIDVVADGERTSAETCVVILSVLTARS